jgi:hypothetical protein
VGCAAEQGSWAEREKRTSWATGGLAGLKAWAEKKRFAKFSKEFKQMNSNTGLNSTNQKLCSSMYATVNSYGSLI